jgi:hypothetical protein
VMMLTVNQTIGKRKHLLRLATLKSNSWHFYTFAMSAVINAFSKDPGRGDLLRYGWK